MRLAHLRLRRACAGLFLLFGIGCSARPAAVAPPTPPVGPEAQVPDEADIIYDDLAEIKAEVLWYYVTKQPENWRAFTVELGRGVYFPPDEYGGHRIGIFELKRDSDGKFALVREPPLERDMFYFGVYLDKKDGKWVVVDEYFEHEWLEIEEP